jgi:hypothetical protein
MKTVPIPATAAAILLLFVVSVSSNSAGASLACGVRNGAVFTVRSPDLTLRFHPFPSPALPPLLPSLQATTRATARGPRTAQTTPEAREGRLSL